MKIEFPALTYHNHPDASFQQTRGAKGNTDSNIYQPQKGKGGSKIAQKPDYDYIKIIIEQALLQQRQL